MEIVLIGLNHLTAPVELRERVHFSLDQARRAAATLRAQGVLREAVLLSTCNRSEVYGVPQTGADESSASVESFICGFHGLDSAALDGSLYRKQDHAAVEHLYRVSAGLDSMLLGEAEILGQVRQAYQGALEEGVTGPALNRLFQAAIEVGKRIRAETELGAHPLSVASAAMKLAAQIFGSLEKHTALVLGAGAMGTKAAEQLRNRGIGRLWVSNRSAERGEELSRRFGGECIAWGQVAEALEQPDIVVSSLSGSEWTLTREQVATTMAARSNRPLFFIDLGVPRNIESAVADLYNVFLYNVDDLTVIVEQNRKSRQSEIPRAEAIIAEHLEKFAAWQAGSRAAAVLDELRSTLRLQREMFARDHAEDLNRFGPEDRERIQRMMDELLESVLHDPSSRLLKEKELRQKLHDIELFRELFGLGKDRA
jgi:glutamyl-tRNA reductase